MNKYSVDSNTIADDVYSDISRQITADDVGINDILDRIFSKKGKVVRPVFMALLGKLAGGSWQEIRKAAFVIESVHIASLIHDDVVDGSSLRRGSATLNADYSDKTSVLFGDLIFMKALSAAHGFKHPRAFSVLNMAIERMIEGEIREELAQGTIDEKTYLEIIGGKTASLFAASGELAVLLSGGDERMASLGGQLGENIGMAFQIIDDTLDFVGKTEVMGKPRLADVMSERFTLPVISAIRTLSQEEIASCLSGGVDSAEAIAEIVRDNGGIDYSYEKAREYSMKAQAILERFGVADASMIFEDFLDMVLSRAY